MNRRAGVEGEDRLLARFAGVLALNLVRGMEGRCGVVFFIAAGAAVAGGGMVRYFLEKRRGEARRGVCLLVVLSGWFFVWVLEVSAWVRFAGGVREAGCVGQWNRVQWGGGKVWYLYISIFGRGFPLSLDASFIVPLCIVGILTNHSSYKGSSVR